MLDKPQNVHHTQPQSERVSPEAKRAKAHATIDNACERRMYGEVKVKIKNGEVESLHVDESIAFA